MRLAGAQLAAGSAELFGEPGAGAAPEAAPEAARPQGLPGWPVFRGAPADGADVADHSADRVELPLSEILAGRGLDSAAMTRTFEALPTVGRRVHRKVDGKTSTPFSGEAYRSEQHMEWLRSKKGTAAVKKELQQLQ